LRDARAGLEAIAPELVQRDDGLVTHRSQGPAAPLPAPRLLGAFDPVLLGWCSRSALLGGHEGAVIRGGMFRPFALAGGRAVAAWRLVGGEVILEPLGRLSKANAVALRSDAKDVLRYLSVPRPDAPGARATPPRSARAGDR
jgi:hypothetical protein